MTESTTVTVRLNQAIKADLDLLAKHTSRSKSYLAAEAIASFVTRELALMEGIDRALADVAAGRVVDHDRAMDEVEAAITDAAARKKALRA